MTFAGARVPRPPTPHLRIYLWGVASRSPGIGRQDESHAAQLVGRLIIVEPLRRHARKQIRRDCPVFTHGGAFPLTGC